MSTAPARRGARTPMCYAPSVYPFRPACIPLSVPVPLNVNRTNLRGLVTCEACERALSGSQPIKNLIEYLRAHPKCQTCEGRKYVDYTTRERVTVKLLCMCVRLCATPEEVAACEA